MTAAHRLPPAAISGKGLIAITFWGASFVMTRIALEAFNPFGLVAVRLGLGAALLVVALHLRGRRLALPRGDRLIPALLGAILASHLLLQAFGLQYTSAINTGWIIGFIPVTIALGAHLLGKQRILGRGWIGVLVGASGVLLVTLDSPPDFADARVGDVLQLVSCFTWTAYTLLATGPVSRHGALTITTGAMGVAALLVFGVAVTTGFLSGPVTVRALAAVGFLGLLCNGVAYYLWLRAQNEHGPARIGSLLYLEPLVTLVTAAAVLREPITVNAVVGGVVVLGGVWLVTHGTRRRRIAAPGT